MKLLILSSALIGLLTLANCTSIEVGSNSDTASTTPSSINKDEVRKTISANINQLKACYEKALNKNPSLYGRLKAQITVDSAGTVKDVLIKDSTMDDATFNKCFIERIKDWKFQTIGTFPKDDLAVITYPFVFQAQE